MNRLRVSPSLLLATLPLWSSLVVHSHFPPASGTPGGYGVPSRHQGFEGDEDPGEVLIQALRSLEGEGEDPGSEWEERVRRDPDDRAALLGLAALDWLLYRYQEAEERFAALLPPGVPPDEVTPFARLSRGDAAQIRGNYRLAGEDYRKALEDAQEVGSRRAETWSHIRLAGIRGRLEGLQAAQEHLVAAERLLEESDSYLRALFHCTRAGADPQRRLSPMEDLDLGASLAREAGVLRIYAACRQVQAAVVLSRGETGRALNLYHEAQGIQASVGDRAGRAGSLQRAGYVFVSLGSYGWAQSYLEQAIVEGEASGSYSPVAWALLNLSTISWGLGDLVSGRSYLERAEAFMTEQGDVAGLDVVTGQKGDIAFAAGDFPAAREYWDAALARYRQRRGPHGEFGIQNALMRLAIAEGDLEAAEGALARSREIGTNAGLGSWVVGLGYDEGELALAKGEIQRAKGAFSAYLAGGQQAPRAYKGRVRMAEVLVLEGDLDQAELYLMEAVEGIEAWRTTLDVSSLRRYAFQVAEVIADPDLGVATVLAALAEAGRVEVSFDLAERQRARGLFESMVRADAARGTSLVQPLAEEENALEATEPLTAAELMRSLPSAEIAIVQFVTGVGGEPTTAFFLTQEGIQAEVLPPIDSIRADLERLNSLVQSGIDPGALAAQLGATLLQPVVDRLPSSIRELAIIPDGALHRLPFDLLSLEGGEGVIHRFSVSLAPSATVLARLWNRDARPPGTRLLALGNPSILTGGERGETTVASGVEVRLGGADLPPLPGSAREARLVARFADQADVLLGSQATEAFLKTAPLKDYRVLHFATHALVDETSLARTALVLAPEGEEDGLVFPGDLARLELGADLVVLSACKTAGGSVIRGEGIQGLTAPLLEAGARAILATRWEIDDRAGRRFVEDLYTGMARDLTVGESLRMAKLAAIERGEPASQWAAFTLVGDPEVRVALTEPHLSWLLVLGVALVAFLVGGWAVGSRRGRGVAT